MGGRITEDLFLECQWHSGGAKKGIRFLVEIRAARHSLPAGNQSSPRAAGKGTDQHSALRELLAMCGKDMIQRSGELHPAKTA